MGGKYAGIKASRRQIYGNGTQSEENGEDGYAGTSEDEQEADEVNDYEADSPDQHESIEDDESLEDLYDDESSRPTNNHGAAATRLARRPSILRQKANEDSRSIQDDSQAMIQELQAASVADAAKGKDVKHQLVSKRCFSAMT